MAKKVFDTQDAVPEALREDATETKDGKWVVYEPEDMSGLQSALETEKTQRAAAEKLAKKVADELKKLQTQRKADESGITAEKLAEIEKQVEERVLEKYKDKIESADALAQEVRSLKLDTQIKTLAGKHGVLGSEMDRWWKLHGDSFDLTTDGKPVVKGKEGVSLEKFIADDLKKETPYLYQGTKAGGGGAGGTPGNPNITYGTSGDDILKNPGAALAAARAAGKTE